MYRKGMSMAAIARLYGCHYTTIGRILRKRNVPIRQSKMDHPATGSGILDVHVNEIR